MSEFLTYSKFYTNEEAEAFAALLQKNGIPFDAEREGATLDVLYLGEDTDPRYLVKVRQQDFRKVNELMKHEMERQVEYVRSDYYLYQFTNEELAEVVRRPDEWNYFDQALAKKLLSQRNVALEAIPVGAVFSEEDLHQPSKLEGVWLVLAYLGAVLFPFAGVPLGAVLFRSKRTLRDGTKVPLFDVVSMNHGWVLLAIGVVRSTLFFLPWYGELKF